MALALVQLAGRVPPLRSEGSLRPPAEDLIFFALRRRILGRSQLHLEPSKWYLSRVSLCPVARGP